MDEYTSNLKPGARPPRLSQALFLCSLRVPDSAKNWLGALEERLRSHSKTLAGWFDRGAAEEPA